MVDFVWGIDLGGTKIEGIVLPAVNSVEPICRIRVATEANHGYKHICQKICTLIEKMTAEVGQKPQALGIATPGMLDPNTGLIKNSNTTCLIGEPLQSDLKNELDIDVELANDANCFALAEARLGAGKGAETVFGIIMGTGVGGGLVIHDRILYGCQGIAGEWGHNVIDAQGLDCYCGRRGCVETFLSGPHLEQFYEKASGVKRRLPDIFQLHLNHSDPAATATIEHLIEYFGRAVAVVINLLDPHVIILGGGVSNIDVLYTEGLKHLEPWVFNDRCQTKIVQNKLGDSAGVFGAAMLVA